MDKSLIAVLLLFPTIALGQTHTMPGSNVVPSGASLTIQSGGSITAAAGSTVTGFGTGGGSVSLTATAPIVVAPSPITGTGVISLDPTSKSNWDTAFTNNLRWDGGSTALVAATGRTSLGGTTVGQSFFTLANPGAVTFPEISAGNVVSTKTAAQMATDLGLVIGTNVQAFDTDLTTWAGITPTTVGQSFVTLANPGAITFPEISATNVVSAKTAAQFKTDLGIPAGSTTQIQYNNAGALGGVPQITYDGTNTVFDLSALASTKIRLKSNTTTATPDGFLESSGGSTVLSQNGYYDGTNWKYDATGPLVVFTLNAGNFAVYTSASGTAGTNATLAAGISSLNSGGVVVGAAVDPGVSNFSAAGTINATTGYKVGGAAASGKILVGNGTNFVASTPTYPNAASPTALKWLRADGTNWIASTSTLAEGAVTAGKILQSDATNWTASTPTWPTTAGTAGYLIQSNGTNFVTYPTSLEAASTATVSAGYAADTYLAGSTVTIAAGDWKVQGVYHCKFDMTKTGAGAATPIVTVRMGTLGTTGDASIGTLTWAVGTGVVDSGVFDIDVVFRSVGSGTSAVIQMMGACAHHLAATGLTTTGASGIGIIVGTSAGFNSTTPTKIGLSFNGGSSFSGTNTIVTATLHQP